MKAIGINHWDLRGPERLERILAHYQPRSITIEFPSDQIPDDIVKLIPFERARQAIEVGYSDVSRNVREVGAELAQIINYEVLIPAEYAIKAGAQITFIDMPFKELQRMKGISAFSPKPKMEFPRIEPLMRLCAIAGTPNELEQATSDEVRNLYQAQCDRSYMKAVIIYAGFVDPDVQSLIAQTKEKDLVEGATMLCREFIEKEERREKFMEDHIRAVQPDMHIGGVKHMYAGFLINSHIMQFLEVISPELSQRYQHKKILADLLSIPQEDRIRLCDADQLIGATQ